MRLILQKDIKNLGKTGDQVLVKKGYARNFLIPKGYALPINKNRLKVWKHQQNIISAKKRKAVVERKALISKLSSIQLKFEKEALKDGKLFGSVTAHEISEALEKQHNISVDKRDLSTNTLKVTGNHKITISLDSENKTDITIIIKGKMTKKREQEFTDEDKNTGTLKKATSKITEFLKGPKKEDGLVTVNQNEEEGSIQTLKSAQAHSIKESETPIENNKIDKEVDTIKSEKSSGDNSRSE